MKDYPISTKVVGTKEVCLREKEYMPCEMDVFTIDGENVDVLDFGVVDFCDDCDCDDDGCCMVFCRHKERDANTLGKYQLTTEEYDGICEILEDAIEIHDCHWCE